jgi:hypothetical protein
VLSHFLNFVIVLSHFVFHRRFCDFLSHFLRHRGGGGRGADMRGAGHRRMRPSLAGRRGAKEAGVPTGEVLRSK